MTEIKRSFRLLILCMALIILVPMLQSADGMVSAMSEFTLSHSLVSELVFGTSVKADGDIVSDAESIYELAEGTVPASEPVLASNAVCESIDSAISYSLYYGIAASEKEPIAITELEREMIAATVQLEVLGKYSRADQFDRPDLKYYELLAVAQIVRNRLLSESFPNDIKTVICDSNYGKNGLVYQFSTSPYINKTNPTELAYAAVDEVFTQGVCVLPDDYYYFCASWRESAFERNNRSVLRFLGDVGKYDKIVADATTFYAGVSMQENINAGYVF